MRRPGTALGILAFGFVALTVAACEQRRGTLTATTAAPPAPVAVVSASVARADAVAQLKARGDELSQRGQHEQALQIYHAALRQEPNDLGLRYAVAVSLSHLNRRQDAVMAFKWVVANGLPQSEPVRYAEGWLHEAGALAAAPARIHEKDRTPTSARLHGRVTWQDVDTSQPAPRVHIILEGTDPENKGKVYNTTTNMNTDYEFPNVLPGAYRVLAQARLVRLWETTVTILDGEPTILNFDQASSIAAPNTFLVATQQ